MPNYVNSLNPNRTYRWGLIVNPQSRAHSWYRTRKAAATYAHNTLGITGPFGIARWARFGPSGRQV